MDGLRRLVGLFVVFLSVNVVCLAQTSVTAHSTSQVADKLVLSATVTNKHGDLVTGPLTRDNFQVLIDHQLAEIVELRGDDVPLSVGILIDASGSVGNPLSSSKARALQKFTQQALISFHSNSNQTNEYFLMAFNKQPQLLMDWTQEPKPIFDNLDSVLAHGNTAFYDACYLALDKVRHGRHVKKVLILFTDGFDNSSTYSLDQVLHELKRSDVLVYVVGSSGDFAVSYGTYSEGREILMKLASLSGGWFFFRGDGKPLNPGDTNGALETLAQELRHQYTLVVSPKVSADRKKWHKLKIKMKATVADPDDVKHFSVRTRQGFYLH